MVKELLNEAERFLIEHWAEARLLEESMDGVRTKYKEVFERIIEAVTEAHPELDANEAYPTQFWGQGLIGFGRKSWPGGESRWPSGFWIQGVRLEVLAKEDAEPPIGYISVSQKAKCDLNYVAARVAVSDAAKSLLTPEELNRTTSTDEGRSLLYLPAPTKQELLASLADGDGQGFVELFVSQFDMMARFLPVLDKVFRECLKKE